MTIKEMACKALLTSTKTYKQIAADIRKASPGAQTTEKSIAFYAHQLRKADKTCLSHRKSNGQTSASTADLIKKYKKS